MATLLHPHESEPHTLNQSPTNDPEAAISLRLEVSALTDVGCVRTNNEDSFGYDATFGLYVVCDGMGGMASGEIASAQAVAILLQVFAASQSSGISVSARLLQAITAANDAVWADGQLPQHKGMGTTLVTVAREGETLVIGNVGDSRAYILQSGQCRQLTVDHSYLNELIRTGAVSVDNAHKTNLNGLESVITRAIGAAVSVQPDFFSVDLTPGTLVLLASDGLTRYLIQEEIAGILLEAPFEFAAAALIELAKSRGGQDNITCLLLRAV
jgi:serine/threonine protein phosphatase PrpC